jgi:hypothetical protein
MTKCPVTYRVIMGTLKEISRNGNFLTVTSKLIQSFCLFNDALSVWRQYSADDRTINECGAVGGMRIGREKRSTGIKPIPLPLCPQ